jgi:hypothetical protein
LVCLQPTPHGLEGLLTQVADTAAAASFAVAFFRLRPRTEFNSRVKDVRGEKCGAIRDTRGAWKVLYEPACWSLDFSREKQRVGLVQAGMGTARSKKLEQC